MDHAVAFTLFSVDFVRRTKPAQILRDSEHGPEELLAATALANTASDSAAHLERSSHPEDRADSQLNKAAADK